MRDSAPTPALPETHPASTGSCDQDSLSLKPSLPLGDGSPSAISPEDANPGEDALSTQPPPPTISENESLAEIEVISPTQAKMRLRHNKKKMAKMLEAGMPEEVARFSNRMDPATFEPWLLVVRARCSGLTLEQISESAEMDLQLLQRIVSDPLFMGFEAAYRKSMRVAPEFELAMQTLTSGLPKVIAALEYWRDQRDARLASASLAACKQWMAAVGIDTERKRVDTRHTSTSIHIDLRKRIREAK